MSHRYPISRHRLCVPRSGSWASRAMIFLVAGFLWSGSQTPAWALKTTFLTLGNADGAGDHVYIANTADVAEGSALTVSLWARTTATGVSIYMVTKGRSGFEQWIMRRVSSGDKVVFSVREQTSNATIAADSPSNAGTDGQWHHYAGVYDGAAQTVRIYIDGSATGTTVGTIDEPMRNDDEAICLGDRATGPTSCATSGTWQGDLDDVRIWNRALSQAEIQANMNSELVGNETGLIAYWKLNEGAGQIAADSTASGLSGQLGTSSGPDTNDPTWGGGGDTTPPTVNITAPAGGATVSGTATTVSANASDNVGVVGVQFKLDGANLGTEDTTSPYSITWNTTTASNGSHALTAVARDAASLSTTSADVTVTVSNTGSPASWQASGSNMTCDTPCNVGIGTTNPAAALDLQSTAGTFRQKNLTQMVTDSMVVLANEVKRFEVARVGIDYNDWNMVGPIEVELYEDYWSQGLKKKYYVSYGYVSNPGVYLAEVGGNGGNNFRVTIGSEVTVTGDQRYLPVYVDVRNYGRVTAVVRTNRTLTTANPPGLGTIWLNSSPVGTTIPDFTPDSVVYVNNVPGFNTVLNQGNVGIGTTSPLSKLSVGDVGDPLSTIYGRNSDGGGEGIAVRGHQTSDGYGVHGASTTGIGVFGGSSGTGGNAYGVYGESNGTGVFGYGATGAYFVANSAGGASLQTGTGKVGIGMAPTGPQVLQVQGNAHFNGTVTGTNIVANYQDVAEWVPAPIPMPAGTVVVLDTERNNQVVASLHAYDTKVAGVISEMPGLLLGLPGEGKVKVATTGRVKVKVDARKGAIKVGDLLVTSDTAGVAMVSKPVEVGGVSMHRPGTIVGKALEPLASGESEILVLLSLQ